MNGKEDLDESVLWEETIQWTCSRFGEFDQALEGTNVIDWIISYLLLIMR